MKHVPSIILGVCLLIPIPSVASDISPLDEQQQALMLHMMAVEKCDENINRGVEAMKAAAACQSPADARLDNTLAMIKRTSKISMLEDAALHGYAVIGKTNVKGPFAACFTGFIPLEDGDLFMCERKAPSTYYYVPSTKSLAVVILRHVNGSTALLIDDIVYTGSLIRQQ